MVAWVRCEVPVLVRSAAVLAVAGPRIFPRCSLGGFNGSCSVMRASESARKGSPFSTARVASSGASGSIGTYATLRTRKLVVGCVSRGASSVGCVIGHGCQSQRRSVSNVGVCFASRCAMGTRICHSRSEVTL